MSQKGSVDLMTRMIEQRANLSQIFIQVSSDLDKNILTRIKNITTYAQKQIQALNRQSLVQGLGSAFVFAINIAAGTATAKSFNISDGMVKGVSEVGKFGTDMGVRSFEGHKILAETQKQLESTQIQKANEIGQSFMRVIDPQAARTSMQIWYQSKNQ